MLRDQVARFAVTQARMDDDLICQAIFAGVVPLHVSFDSKRGVYDIVAKSPLFPPVMPWNDATECSIKLTPRMSKGRVTGYAAEFHFSVDEGRRIAG